jgi:hypothetical protein
VDDYGHTEVLYFNFDTDSVLTAAQDAGTATDLVSHHDGAAARRDPRSSGAY